MKKAIVMFLAAILVLPAIAGAQESALKTRSSDEVRVEKTNKLDELKKQMEARREDREDRREDRQIDRQDKREDRLSNHLALVTDRIDAAFTRIGELLARAGKYIEQLEGRGANMSNARKAEAEATAALNAAKAALTNLPNNIGTVTDADKLTSDNIKNIREAIRNVTSLTKIAVQKTQDLIKSIRETAKPLNTTQSSSNEPTTQPTPVEDTVPERVN